MIAPLDHSFVFELCPRSTRFIILNSTSHEIKNIATWTIKRTSQHDHDLLLSIKRFTSTNNIKFTRRSRPAKTLQEANFIKNKINIEISIKNEY